MEVGELENQKTGGLNRAGRVAGGDQEGDCTGNYKTFNMDDSFTFATNACCNNF